MSSKARRSRGGSSNAAPPTPASAPASRTRSHKPSNSKKLTKSRDTDHTDDKSSGRSRTRPSSSAGYVLPSPYYETFVYFEPAIMIFAFLYFLVDPAGSTTGLYEHTGEHGFMAPLTQLSLAYWYSLVLLVALVEYVLLTSPTLTRDLTARFLSILLLCDVIHVTNTFRYSPKLTVLDLQTWTFGVWLNVGLTLVPLALLRTVWLLDYYGALDWTRQQLTALGVIGEKKRGRGRPRST